MKLAIILPVYNEQGAILSNFETIFHEVERGKEQALVDLEVSYLMVDDGSKDKSWSDLEEISRRYPSVHAVKFSRNFGKEVALRAGVDHIEADYYVTMDSDLQHPPAHIIPMLNLLVKENVSIVNGIKSHRGKEKRSSRFFAKGFYKLLDFLSGMNLDNSSDFKVMKREVINAVGKMGERKIFFRGIVDWLGFPCLEYPFVVEERQAGETSFSMKSLVKMALSSIISFSAKPLIYVMYMGFLFLLFAVLLGIQTLYNFLSGNAISGFSTVILLLLVSGSSIMIALAIIGIYIARIFEEVKGRPIYIVEKSI